MRLFYLLVASWMMISINGAAYAKHHTQKKTIARTVTRQSASPIYGAERLREEINYIVNAGNGNADIAVFVKSMKFGDVLYTHNINQSLTPASTIKVLTAEASLLYLGPEYRFSTQLLTDGKTVKDGVLQGNLYVVLSGDPSLTYYDLIDLLLALKSQQIQAIAGNVYIDNTAYDQSFYGPGWVGKDKNSCYGAPISASIINHNCLPFKMSSTGRAVEVITSPKYFYPAIKNGLTQAGRSRCSIRLSTSASSIISIDGCMPRGRFAWGASYVVTDVPEYNRELFKSLLSKMGVNVYGRVTFASAPRNLSMVGQHASKPLRMLINDMLKKSDNVIAGALFKKIGQLYTRQPGSWENGSYAVSQILSKQAGVNVSGMRILDGSGISPNNLISPAQMMQVLDYAYHHYPTSYEFISALPIAGVDGTLKGRMGNIARKVRAKTGTISGVVSLAGYATSGEKEPLAFVIMVNGHKGMSWQYRSLEDKIATALTRYVRTS